MPFEPSTLYTTVAQCSATIVAILGGFIASKLITISSERSEAQNRLKEIENQQEFVIIEHNELVKEKEYEDAYNFINRHINDLIEGSNINDIYNIDKDYYIELATIHPYWEHALELRIRFTNEEKLVEYKDNENNVLQCLEKTLTKDDLLLVKSILDELCMRDQSKYLASTRDDFFDVPPINYNAISEDVHELNIEYRERNKQIDKYSSDLKWLSFQKDEAVKKKNYYIHPEGMRSGIIMLSCFSVFNIILPLIFLVCDIKSMCINVSVISLFAIGIGCVVCYLADLLRWKD